MHYIQKHILDELRTAQSIRYAKLNPGDIESGHFRYHLEQLIRDGYVGQLERGVYGLTTKGQQFVDKLSSTTINPSPMPKVITYTLLRDGDKVLLQEKSKQPYLGLLNMIGGKLHHGELAHDAAVREVYEKTGNMIDKPELAGVFEILVKLADDILTHTVAYVFVVNVETKDYASDNLRILGIETLGTITDLAPDFMPIYVKITNTSGLAVDSIVVRQ